MLEAGAGNASSDRALSIIPKSEGVKIWIAST